MKDYPYAPGWRLNEENNKPATNHSILMLTMHGVAEGEWDGKEWVQYRWSCKLKDSEVLYWIHLEDLQRLGKEGDNLEQEQPEPYFYCKYGGTIPLCSDCKRNHNNSSFKTEEITTWYAPSNGTKHCIDYIQQKQPEVDLEKEINNCFPKSYFENGVRINFDDVVDMAHHFYELGLNARKEE